MRPGESGNVWAPADRDHVLRVFRQLTRGEFTADMWEQGEGGPWYLIETRGGLWWKIGGRGIEYSQEIKNKGLMWSFAFEPELTCWAWFTNDSLGQNPDCEEVTSPLAKSRVPLTIVRHLRHFRSCWVRVYKDLDLIVWCTINAAVN